MIYLLNLKKFLLALFRIRPERTYGNKIYERATFLRTFGYLWTGTDKNRDEPIFSGCSDQYLSEIFSENCNKKTKNNFSANHIKNMFELRNKSAEKQVIEWLNEMVGDNWGRLSDELKITINSGKALYDLIAKAIEDEYKKLTESEKKSEAKLGEEEIEATEANCPKAARVEQAKPTVYFGVQDGVNHIEYHELEPALEKFENLSQDSLLRPMLYIQIENLSDTILVYYNLTKKTKLTYLRLPKPMPAEMLRCPEIYIAVAKIILETGAILETTRCNSLFERRIWEILASLGDTCSHQKYLDALDEFLLYNDEKTNISFEVRKHLFSRAEKYDDFNEAHSFWDSLAWQAVLFLIVDNAEAQLHKKIPIFYLRRPHFEQIYKHPTVFASPKVHDFFDTHCQEKCDF